MALLDFASRTYAQHIAIIDDGEKLTYEELMKRSSQFSQLLKEHYQIEANEKVALFCRNHATLVMAIFALSRLGVQTYFINTELSKQQFEKLVQKQGFKMVLYDDAYNDLMQHIKGVQDKLSITEVRAALKEKEVLKSSKPISTSKLILLTSGSTGEPKEITHKPSLFNYLAPFIGMLERLKLLQYKSVYIATPIYHGYGIAIMLLFITLGKKIVITEKFEAKKGCALIHEHQIEIVTVVPLMIHKMLIENSKQLHSVKCFASGGAVLPPTLVKEVREKLGDVVYNLYGTSETGLNIIATPEDLHYSDRTLGRPIQGLGIKICINRQQGDAGEIGELCVKAKSGMENSNANWISTGDLAYKDKNGYYYLVGRKDDMIVSAGENVYPTQVEMTLLQHPSIEDAAVIGVDDEIYGQRLHAFVQQKASHVLNEEALEEWLKNHLARYEMPREITFVEQLPYTTIGKLSKKQLHASKKISQ